MERREEMIARLNELVNDEPVTAAARAEALEQLCRALAPEIYGAEHAGPVSLSDIRAHIGLLAAENDLADTPEYLRFEEAMGALCEEAAELARKSAARSSGAEALRLLELEPDTRILCGLTLRDGEEAADYDFIVLSPRGIFVLEAEQCAQDMRLARDGSFYPAEEDSSCVPHYNLGEAMNRREYLLRKALAEKAAGVPYTGLLLYTSRETALTDDYGLLPVCYCSSAADAVRKAAGEPVLSAEQVESLAAALGALNSPAAAPVLPDAPQFLSDFAWLATRPEELADIAAAFASEDDDSEEKAAEKTPFWKDEEFRRNAAEAGKQLVGATLAGMATVGTAALGVAILIKKGKF